MRHNQGMAGIGIEVKSSAVTRRWTEPELRRLAIDGRVAVAHLLPPEPDATHASFESTVGDYRASIPLGVARDQGVVILGDGGCRLLVEEGDTLCWNVKDLGSIRLTLGPEPDSVPENPPH